jgi:hypothetical protein
MMKQNPVNHFFSGYFLLSAAHDAKGILYNFNSRHGKQPAQFGKFIQKAMQLCQLFISPVLAGRRLTGRLRIDEECF